jgi:hypothetical protein
MFKNIKTKIQIFWHALFRGLASADSIINAPLGSENSHEIVQQQRVGGVMDDLLEQKETQRVIETRDKYYRVLKEADKWDVSSIKIIGEDENGVIFSGTDGLKKKSKLDFMKHPPVYNEENLPLRTIQDNKQIQKQNNLISGYNAVFDKDLMPLGLTDYETTLTIVRDEFTPRFALEKYTKRMVVRENGERAYVDLYLPTQASQFGKVDAILIANLNRIWEEKNLKSDLTDFKEMWWYSDKAWGSEDVCIFKYDDINFVGINVFDGSFVLTFDCNVVENGTDLTLKYRTKELDLKYANEEAKTDAVDLFALMRREKRRENKEKDIDVNNLTTTTLNLS